MWFKVHFKHSFKKSFPAERKERKKEKNLKLFFPVSERASFQSIVVPFGLSDTAQKQQRLCNSLIGPRFELNIFSYFEDIYIVSFHRKGFPFH